MFIPVVFFYFVVIKMFIFFLFIPIIRELLSMSSRKSPMTSGFTLLRLPTDAISLVRKLFFLQSSDGQQKNGSQHE